MTEFKRIKSKLASKGRAAYKTARSSDNAFIVIGNSIYRVSADGSKLKMEDLSTTRVKARQKKFIIK